MQEVYVNSLRVLSRVDHPELVNQQGECPDLSSLNILTRGNDFLWTGLIEAVLALLGLLCFLLCFPLADEFK
jgi:hypothetical protein